MNMLLGIIMVQLVVGVVVGNEKNVIVDRQASYHSSVFINENKTAEDAAVVVDAKDETRGDDSECRVEYVVVESVHYSEVMTTECRSHNLTSCHTEPYEECHDQLREECHQRVREECHDKLEEECHIQYRTEHSQEAVRECERECQYRWEGTDDDKRWVVDTAPASVRTSPGTGWPGCPTSIVAWSAGMSVRMFL